MTGWGPVRRAAGAALLAARAAAADVSADVPAGRLLEGELVRVDLAKRILVLRPAGGPPREVDVTVDAATAITGSGRSLQLEDLKPAEKIAVTCDGAAGRSCRARRVRSGPPRHSVPPAAVP